MRKVLIVAAIALSVAFGSCSDEYRASIRSSGVAREYDSIAKKVPSKDKNVVNVGTVTHVNSVYEPTRYSVDIYTYELEGQIYLMSVSANSMSVVKHEPVEAKKTRQ